MTDRSGYIKLLVVDRIGRRVGWLYLQDGFFLHIKETGCLRFGMVPRVDRGFMFNSRCEYEFPRHVTFEKIRPQWGEDGPPRVCVASGGIWLGNIDGFQADREAGA